MSIQTFLNVLFKLKLYNLCGLGTNEETSYLIVIAVYLHRHISMEIMHHCYLGRFQL